MTLSLEHRTALRDDHVAVIDRTADREYSYRDGGGDYCVTGRTDNGFVSGENVCSEEIGNVIEARFDDSGDAPAEGDER